MIRTIYLDTPCGRLGITATNEAVIGIRFGDFPHYKGPASAPCMQQTGAQEKSNSDIRMTARRSAETIVEDRDGRTPPLLTQATRELREYFAGRRRVFTFPISMQGTPFQQEVWRALQSIPYGQTRTYRQIAAQIGHPKAARAVGMANHRNPLPIVIPCHRVIGADGTLTGYAGGLDTKKLLLRLEEQ